MICDFSSLVIGLSFAFFISVLLSLSVGWNIFQLFDGLCHCYGFEVHVKLLLFLTFLSVYHKSPRHACYKNITIKNSTNVLASKVINFIDFLIKLKLKLKLVRIAQNVELNVLLPYYFCAILNIVINILNPFWVTFFNRYITLFHTTFKAFFNSANV